MEQKTNKKSMLIGFIGVLIASMTVSACNKPISLRDTIVAAYTPISEDAR